MRFEIQKLHRRLSTTSLYVTHDQVEAMTLAHRMIVMNAGRAEQIGTPMEVYEDPQTLFVAGFIGSPAMNFMTGKVDANGTVVLDRGGAVRIEHGRAESGRAVTVGIRPEHLRPSGAADAFVTGTVEMVEQLGADTLVHIAHGVDPVIVRLPHGVSPDVGTSFSVTAEPSRVFLFDASTGVRLR
jgi:sn-glycerol 3-phosphate transport system ATP-binding protein